MSEIGGKELLVMVGYGSTRAVTFQDSGDTVTLNAHGYVAGQVIRFSVITTTTGISIDTDYYVISPTTNTFQVAATLGGSAIALTNNGTGTMYETFTKVGGMRANSFKFDAEAIDITNQDSSEWKKILDSAGVRSVSISCSGVFEDGVVYHQVRTAALANTLKNFRFIVNAAGDYYSGSFKITSTELSGNFDAETEYSMEFQSSGEVTFTEV